MSNFTNTNRSAAATLSAINKSTTATFSNITVTGDEFYNATDITYSQSNIKYNGRTVTWTGINKS